MSEKEQKNADWVKLSSLYSAYLAGDSVATGTLFHELTRVLKAYFGVRLRSSPETASDLVQATLLKIHFSRDRFDPAQSLKTWVFTVASRTLIDHWRGHASDQDRFEHSEPLDILPSELLGPALKTELHGDLNEALKTLKPTERSIVYLYGVEGFSMAEIAESLQISESAVKVRAHRAYKELRKLLSIGVVLFLGEWFS